MRKEDKWTLPPHVKDNWDKIEYEMVLTIFQQAEKRLNGLVKASEGITVKALKVLGFAVTILTISLGYALTPDTDGKNEILTISSYFTSALGFFSVLFLIKPIWSYDFYTAGSSPKLVLRRKELITKFKGKNQAKNLLISECCNYQERINYNLRSTLSRRRYVNIAIILLVATPLTLITSFIISRWSDFF